MHEQTQDKSRSPEQLVLISIIFLGVNAVAIALCVAGALSTERYRSFPDLADTYRCLMASELAFVLFLWPVLGGKRSMLNVPVLAVLAVISAPLVLIAASVANTGADAVLRSHLLLFSIAAAVIATWQLLRASRAAAARWYFLVVAALSGGLPLLQFLTLDLAGAQLRWLAVISPFWAMELAQRSLNDVPRSYWAVSVLVPAGVAAVMTALKNRRKN